MTDEQAPTDPHNLLTSGEETATAGELARILAVPRVVLNALVRGVMYPHVRFVRPPKPSPSLFSVADARAAIEPQRAAIEERRRKAEAHRAAEQAAAAARKAAKAPPANGAKKAARTASKPAPAATRPGSTGPRRGGRAQAAGGVTRRPTRPMLLGPQNRHVRHRGAPLYICST